MTNPDPMTTMHIDTAWTDEDGLAGAAGLDPARLARIAEDLDVLGRAAFQPAHVLSCGEVAAWSREGLAYSQARRRNRATAAERRRLALVRVGIPAVALAPFAAAVVRTI